MNDVNDAMSWYSDSYEAIRGYKTGLWGTPGKPLAETSGISGILFLELKQRAADYDSPIG